MGALKSVNNIDIHYQFADFSVETPGYWKLRAHNDFDNGDLVKVNGVPVRDYHHKLVLKFDFSKLGDAFTDSVRMTLTNLLNEVFVTLFADNQPFISAVTPGSYDAPLTYSLNHEKGLENAEKCIFIIEDSQLDIGLLIAVERNANRILQIISDYLAWNDEQIAESIRKQNEPAGEKASNGFDVYAEDAPQEKKKGFFGRIGAWFKNLFKKKDKKVKPESEDGLTPRQRKKAEKAAKKVEKQAAKEQKKAQRQEEKLRKEQEKAAKKEAKAAQKIEEEVSAEEVTEEEIPAEELPAEESVAEEDITEAPVVEEASNAEEVVDAEEQASKEETVAEDFPAENDAENPKQMQSEGEVNEDA